MRHLSHIAVINDSSRPDSEVATWTEAVSTQLERDVCPAWGFPVPGMFFYGKRTPHPPLSDEGTIWVIDRDDMDSAGYHTIIAGRAYGIVDCSQSSVPSRTLSHEALEMVGNPWISAWAAGPNGLWYARELCDAPQRQVYDIECSMFGVVTKVQVSNFILPAWFRVADGDVKVDHLDLIKRPFTNGPGGYTIAAGSDGKAVYLASPEGMEMSAESFRRHARKRRIVELNETMNPRPMNG